jgi:hypothetical protein
MASRRRRGTGGRARRGPGPWWIARLLVRCEFRGKPKKDLTYEHSFRLVRARSPGEALRKAAALGRKGEISYEGAMGDLVEWKFQRVLEVQELLDGDRPPREGTEVFLHHVVVPGRRRFRDPLK